jgi:hypothetical protein
MQINTSVQLGLEQALKALIPYLQSLDDPDGIWDFLDVFPAADPEADPPVPGFTFIAGHGSDDKPQEKTDFLAFISSLPNYRAIGMRHPQLLVKMELITGVLKPDDRATAVVTHSQRVAALIQLFSARYRGDSRRRGPLLNILNTIEDPDNRPWKGLGFSAWLAQQDYPQDGISQTGNAFVANPAYIFTVHFESQPAI